MKLVCHAAWEPIYEPAAWHRFLEGRGYAPLAERVWGKAVQERGDPLLVALGSTP